MSADLSRRAALTGIALAGGVALAPVAIASLPKPGADRSAWNAAQAERRAALAASEQADKAFDAAFERYEAKRPSMDMIHWREFSFEDRDHVARTIDVEKRWAFYLKGEGKWWWSNEREKTIARVRAAYDSVLEWRRLDKEANDAAGYDAASDALDASFDRIADADAALLQMPAPDAEALLWKLEMLNELSGPNEDQSSAGWSAKTVNAVMADARRILSQGRA
ncbi:MAG TPA: hypothetical protein VF655_10050 [Allosphingosinicella sp.]